MTSRLGTGISKSFFYGVARGFPLHSTQHKPLTGVISNLFSTLRMYSHFLNKSFLWRPPLYLYLILTQRLICSSCVLERKCVQRRGVAKRCHLYWLTNSASYINPNAGGGGVGDAGPQPMSAAEHMEPKLEI